MPSRVMKLAFASATAVGALALVGCKQWMPHSFTWPYGGDVQYSHAKPPGTYYKNWDPFAVELEVTPLQDLNPVRTQHVLIARVKDKEGKPLRNRRVEWIISEGSVGDIVEVDESGLRASRGYKVDNHYAVSHTNWGDHVLDRGNSDPSDDIQLEDGDTWCVITSPVEGTTYVTVYAPGIYDWGKHKVFAVKHWYDVKWEFPPPATNPIGTPHEFVTKVTQYSDGAPLAGYQVTYKIVDGPDAVFEPGGNKVATVATDASGLAKVTLKQTKPAEGTNNVTIDIVRPENVQCCKPAVHIASGKTSKTWIGPKIAIDKNCTASAMVGDAVTYTIDVTNPSQVAATNVVVTDTIPDGIQYVSSTPAGQVSGNTVTWTFPSLAPAGKTSIQVQAKATRIGKFENCAEVRADANLQARDCCTTVVTSPKLTIEKKCPAEVVLCDPIEYVITVRNTGDGMAKNVKVTDQLPAGLATTDGKTSVLANVGDLGPGQSKEIRFTVKASKTGRYENRVAAAGDGGLTAEATCTTVVKQPALEVTKTGPKERFIGRDATYEITVKNTGDAPARDTVLSDPLPSGVQFVSASDGGSNQGGTVTWRLGTLEPGASKKVSVVVKAMTAGSVKNTAKATAFCAEGTATTDMSIAGIPAVLLEVVDLEDPDEVGTTETYVITVTNQGSADATNVRIVAEVQPEAEYVSSTGATQGSAVGRTVTFAPLASIPPKGKAEWRVVVKGIKAGDTRFKVQLTTAQTEATGPINESESTRFYE